MNEHTELCTCPDSADSPHCTAACGNRTDGEPQTDCEDCRIAYRTEGFFFCDACLDSPSAVASREAF